MTFARAFTFTIFGLLMTVGYQNCGADFVVKQDLMLTSLASQGIAQGPDCEMNAFGASYHTFLKAKCAGCHGPSGPGSGAFAAADLSVAFNSFALATTSKVNERATNAQHAVGITGPANQTSIDQASATWTSAMAICRGTASTPAPTGATSATREIAINRATADQTLTWNLNSDVSPSPGGFGTAVMTIRVQSAASPTPGMTLYSLSLLRVTTGAVALHVNAVGVRINGIDQPLVTTFSRLDQTVPAAQTNRALSTATAQFEFPTATTTDNRLSLTFGAIDHP